MNWTVKFVWQVCKLSEQERKVSFQRVNVCVFVCVEERERERVTITDPHMSCYVNRQGMKWTMNEVRSRCRRCQSIFLPITSSFILWFCFLILCSTSCNEIIPYSGKNRNFRLRTEWTASEQSVNDFTEEASFLFFFFLLFFGRKKKRKVQSIRDKEGSSKKELEYKKMMINVKRKIEL